MKTFTVKVKALDDGRFEATLKGSDGEFAGACGDREEVLKEIRHYLFIYSKS